MWFWRWRMQTEVFNLFFGNDIQGGSKLVKDKNVRIFKQLPGEGNALLPTVGEFYALFADFGFVTLQCSMPLG